MKELSIEEKAKRYDEAIKIAEKINNEQRAQPFNVMIRVFPELKESEDWISKEIANYLKEKGDFRSCWITWLEKQKSTVDINDVCEWLQKYAKCYVNSEYNDYHNCVEYDGTIDVDSMIERLKYNFG